MATKKKDNILNVDYVEVFVPRTSANGDQNYFVGINGKNYIMPRGKKTMVPPAVAKEIARSLAAEDKMYEAQEALKGLAK